MLLEHLYQSVNLIACFICYILEADQPEKLPLMLTEQMHVNQLVANVWLSFIEGTEMESDNPTPSTMEHPDLLFE